VKTMEKIMARMTLGDKVVAGEQKNLVNQQQIRHPFQANFAEGEVVDPSCFVVDSCHHELETNCFIYSIEDGHEERPAACSHQENVQLQ